MLLDIYGEKKIHMDNEYSIDVLGGRDGGVAHCVEFHADNAKK